MRLCLSAIALALFMLPHAVAAFCGFYVGSDDDKLYNDATQVVLMRDGTTTVLSMQNNYEGPAEDFAMVVPVPEVLQKENVKVLPKDVFDAVDKLSAPRLVEYWEQDPCRGDGITEIGSLKGASGRGYGRGAGALGEGGTVVVEAEFEVGEYDIVILSASEGTALEAWLETNGYKTPAGAAPFYQPYVEGGSYFFVAKVDVKRASYKDGRAVLSPLRFHFTEDEFKLPIRLGLINAREEQDLLVYTLGNNQRFELANYPNAFIPTNLEVNNSVRTDFPGFYEALFQRTVAENPNAVITEYSWQAGGCDPCPNGATGLDAKQLSTLGADVIPSTGGTNSLVIPGKAIVQGVDTNLVRRIVRQHRREISFCHASSKAVNEVTTLELQISPEGKVTKASFDSPTKAFSECVEQRASAWLFPKAEIEKPATAAIEIRSTVRAGRTPWVLTRLHARYRPEGIGEDLVFKTANPVVGGREALLNGMKTSHGADPAHANAFQGRYIIRHEWAGEVTCDSPRRGVWGGPVDGSAYTAQPAASRNTMGDGAKPMDLKSALRATAADDAPPAAADVPPAAAEEPKAPKSGCSTIGGTTASSWLLAAAGLALMRRRRRRLLRRQAV